MERVNNGNIASEALALETVQCKFQPFFFSKKENVLVVVFSKMQYPEKENVPAGVFSAEMASRTGPRGK